MNPLDERESQEIENSASQLIQKPDRQISFLIATSALYIGFGSVLGLIQGGLPAILLASGWGIAPAGLSYAFYLPFGLAFLWASWIDRWKPPFGRTSIAWIFWMQGLSCLIIAAIAFIPDQYVTLFVLLGIMLAFSMATMDLALDGFSVHRIKQTNRNRAASMKFASLAFGSILGGGILVGQFDILQRQGLFLSLAIILALLIVPLAIISPKMPCLIQNNLHKASLINIFRNRYRRKQLLLLCLIAASISPATGINRLMLVSMGMPLTEIGWIVGTFGPISMMIASGLAFYLMSQLGYRSTLICFTLISIGSICCMIIGISYEIRQIALIGVVIIGGSVGGIFVVYGAQIMKWAYGDQPVTDYAAYYGMGRFSATITTVLGAVLAGAIGWVWYFSCMFLIFILIFIYFYKGRHQ